MALSSCPDNWMDVVLSDVLSPKGYIRGPFGSALKRNELLTSGIPVYEQQHAIYESRDFRFFISKEKYQSMKRFATQTDDLIISCSGTLGKISIIRENDPMGIISQALLLLRVNKQIILPLYLKYFFSSKEGFNAIISRSSGSVQVNISKRADIEQISIKLPPLSVQKRIVANISALNQKIELNTRMNKVLEEIARALFQRWFVAFEFPNAEGKPYKSAGGKMVESEMGMVPEGWKVSSLDQIADFLNGIACQKYPPKEGEENMPVIKIRELRNGNLNEADRVSRVVPEKYYVQNGDVLFSWSGSLMLDIWTSGEGVLNQHLFKVTSDTYQKWFYYFWTKYHLEEFQNIAADKATTMGHIQRKHLNQAKVIVPNIDTLKRMDAVMSPIIAQIIQNNLEVNTLSELRDGLLPKLMSGELDIGLMQC